MYYEHRPEREETEMTAPDPFVITMCIFFGCMFTGFGLAFVSKSHPKIGGALMISGGILFLLLSAYCLNAAFTPVIP